jgi:hypothetical protein
VTKNSIDEKWHDRWYDAIAPRFFRGALPARFERVMGDSFLLTRRAKEYQRHRLLSRSKEGLAISAFSFHGKNQLCPGSIRRGHSREGVQWTFQNTS